MHEDLRKLPTKDLRRFVNRTYERFSELQEELLSRLDMVSQDEVDELVETARREGFDDGLWTQPDTVSPDYCTYCRADVHQSGGRSPSDS